MPWRSQVGAGLIRSTRHLLRALRDAAGADLAEWGLVFSLMALGSTAAIGTIAQDVGIAYNNVAAKFAFASGAASVSGNSYSGRHAGSGNRTGTGSSNAHARKATNGGG